jgi:hypothetical protein
MDIAAKIPDAELLSFARRESSATLDVLVELDVPSLKVEMIPQRSSGFRSFRPAGIVTQEPCAESELERKMSQTRALLEAITGADPTWLRSARAFVIHATGQQLQRIAASPLTRAIHPNRHL